MKFCENLSGERCTLLKEECFRVSQQKKCDLLIYHHPYLRMNPKDSPKTKELKRRLLPRVLEKWKQYARAPSPGKKNMTGGPLEKEIRLFIREDLSKLGVEVPEEGRKFEAWGGMRIIPDCLITKEGRPTSIVSVKCWIGPTQLRETFAYAYFSKTWLGHKHIRVYMIELQKPKEYLRSAINRCSPYIDGVYSVSQKPYFDGLLEQLKNLYRHLE